MVETELNTILSDSKKKYPESKEKLLISIQWIEENKNKDYSKIDENLTLLLDCFFCIVDNKL